MTVPLECAPVDGQVQAAVLVRGRVLRSSYCLGLRKAVFADAGGSDIIWDFGVGGVDLIDLSGLGTQIVFEDLMITGDDTTTFVDYGEGIVQLSGVAESDLLANSFIFA